MERFYRVEYNGVILRHEKCQDEEGYYGTSIMVRNDDDRWEIDIDKPTFTIGRYCMGDETIRKNIADGKFFIDIEDAIEKSKPLWEKTFGSPDDLWEVIEIFDDVEIKVISKPMSKRLAKEEKSKYKNRYLVHYDIRKYKNK